MDLHVSCKVTHSILQHSTVTQLWPTTHSYSYFTRCLDRNLHNSSELFIYCGHGAGEKICDTHKMRRWSCPSAILWGCSSGRLSVQGVSTSCLHHSLDFDWLLPVNAALQWAYMAWQCFHIECDGLVAQNRIEERWPKTWRKKIADFSNINILRIPAT